jgi:hypothetical protein
MTTAVQSRAVHTSRYSETGASGRDQRIDLLRGAALIFLAIEVVSHLIATEQTPFESTSTVSAIGLILVLEGALVGMRDRPRVAAGDLGDSTLKNWRQARRWYLTGLTAAVLVVVARFIPGVQVAPITAQTVARADHPQLFGTPPVDATAIPLAYPVDPQVILDVVFLRIGAWPLDVIGVAIVLFLTAPLMLRVLSRRWAVLLVLVAAVVYWVELLTHLRILPTRAEASLPILGWQAVFVVGLVAGYYRRELVRWFRRGVGLVVFLAVTIATVGWLGLPMVLDLIGPVVPTDVLGAFANPITGWLFEPSAPGPLRVAVVLNLAVAGYGLLTVAWRPISAVLGWLLNPLGSELLAALVALAVTGVTLSSIPALANDPFTVALMGVAAIGIMWTTAKIRSAARRRAVAL